MGLFFRKKQNTMGPTSDPVEEVTSHDEDENKSPATRNVDKVESSSSGPSGQESQQPQTDYAGANLRLSPAEKALKKKVDWHLMPTSFLLYFMNYLDRTAIGAAKLNGLEDDLGLHGQQ
jgi:hypothetical protein